MVQLGRELARLTGQDFGAQLQDLARRGWLRGPRGFFCDYELTEAGRRAARDKLDPWRADTPELGEMMRRL